MADFLATGARGSRPLRATAWFGDSGCRHRHTPVILLCPVCVLCVCVSLSYYLLLFEMNLACICVTVCVQWTTGVMYSCDDTVRVCVLVSVVQLCAVERGERGRNRLRIPPWLTTAQPPR
eukprot:COSAG01_NODE_37719_length_499_cov_5.910000_2_plen_119_part_01